MKGLKFPGVNGFPGFLSALTLWLLIAAPLAVASTAVATWPSTLTAPLVCMGLTCLGVLAGIAVQAYLLTRHPEEKINRRYAVFATVTVSFILLQYVVWSLALSATEPTLRSTLSIASSTLLGVVSFWFVNAASSSRWLRNHGAVVFNWKTRRHVFWGALVATAIAGLPIVIYYRLKYDQTGIFREKLIENPGGIFSFVVGVFTLIGVYVALQSLTVHNQNVTTFSDMVRRLCDLIRATPEEDYVRLLCYTPLTGSLGISPQLFNELHDLLQGRAKRVAIVALKDDDLEMWLERFEGKSSDYGIVDDAQIENALMDARGLLKTLEERREHPGHFRPRRLAYSDMPGYYLFSNSERAIVVAPLALPPLTGQDSVSIKKLGPVQMVGIETADPDIVARVNALHLYYYAHFRSENSPEPPVLVAAPDEPPRDRASGEPLQPTQSGAGIEGILSPQET